MWQDLRLMVFPEGKELTKACRTVKQSDKNERCKEFYTIIGPHTYVIYIYI